MSSSANRVTRDERRITSAAHKYSGTQLIETLTKYLQAPDSPALQVKTPVAIGRPYVPPNRTTGPPSNTGNRQQGTPSGNRRPFTQRRSGNQNRAPGTSSAPAPVRVHHLNVSGSEDSADSDDFASLTQEIYDMEVPEDDDAREMFHVYSACIHRIKTQPNVAGQQPCIVCGGNHRFDGCDVLSNVDFLRQHYIRWCQQLRREASARNETFDGNAGNVPGMAQRVNSIDVDSLEQETVHVSFVDTVENEEPATTSSDFQTGRS